ncbi:hypothetical protein HY972_01105 [Candidatus Kaiserbacteria bacterium]|nr:hypothetical protein [Candidatus Kaiserbacteria bacterium]
MKKAFLISLIALFFGLAPHVFAAAGDFVPLAPIPGLTEGVTANTAGLANFLNNLYKFLIGIAAILAVIEIIWGGLEISTQDSVSKNKDGKDRIKWALFGLVLVLSPVLVFSIINPSILNLSVNLPKLDTGSGFVGSSGSGTGTQTPAVDPASGCRVVGAAGILQIATCPSQTAATTWSNTCSGRLSAGPLTKLADGTITSTVLLCAGTQSYIFIDLTTDIINFSRIISRMQPLARTSDNPNNGTTAIQFANTCASFGWETCISDRPRVTFSVPCLPTPTTSISSTASGKCYKEVLSCEDAGVASADVCSGNPSWTPFQ